VPSDETRPVSPIPGHLHTVTPRLVVRDGAAAIDFYRDAFGAIEVGERFTGPHGELIHAEVRIGDSVVMISDEGEDGAPARAPDSLGGVVSAIMATYWEDVDAVWARAVAAGAQEVFPLADQFYGDRGGRLRDPFGQQWMLSQRIEHVPGEEMERRAASGSLQPDAPSLPLGGRLPRPTPEGRRPQAHARMPIRHSSPSPSTGRGEHLPRIGTEADLPCPRCGELVPDARKYTMGQQQRATCPQCHAELVRDADAEDNTWKVEQPMPLLDEEPGGGD
jgi:PhnB protein